MVKTVRQGQTRSVDSHATKSPVTQSQRKSSQSKSKKGAPIPQSPVVEYPCKVCKKNVGQEDSLQCDNCDSWSHLGCTSLSQTQYNFLHDYPSDNFKWFCQDCNNLLPLNAPNSKPVDDTRLDLQDKKIDALTTAINDICLTDHS